MPKGFLPHLGQLVAVGSVAGYPTAVASPSSYSSFQQHCTKRRKPDIQLEKNDF